MGKVILDLCGGTGAWSRPYVEAGYTVYNITLPQYDLMEFNQKLYTLCFPEKFEQTKGPTCMLKRRKTLYIPIQIIYGILAAPDCAHFSFARQRAKTPRDIAGAFGLVKKCLEIIEICVIYGNLKFWCLENPKGYLYKILGKPAFSFERWHYGDIGNKLTHTWGNFNFPKMKPKPELKDNTLIQKSHWQKISIPDGYRQKGWCSKKIKRAITPPGFAKAFFKANK
jgi:hypothetical protein